MKNEEVKTKKQSVYIKTFGCQMNAYDSEKIQKVLENNYDTVSNASDADLVIINTCSVRDKPEHKLFSLLGEIKELKETNSNLVIGVGGCVAQQEGENIIKRSRGGADFVFGTHNISLVPSLLENFQNGLGPQVAVDYRDEWEDLPLGFNGENRISVPVSISRGCNKNCAYCIVPRTRGKEVSRSAIEIEREVKIAAHRGAKEILLLGQTVNSYGLDLTPRIKFSELLDRLSQIEEIKRIRFISPHPQEIKDDFIELIAKNSKICRHIHMPLQSGSDQILKTMNRNYRRKRYIEIINSLKQACPDIEITTDVIVGFPGETEENFQDTLNILDELRFINSYSYIFSKRPQTLAEKMPNQIEEEVKSERLKRYQEKQLVISQEVLSNYIGKTVEVLIEKEMDKQGTSYYFGRTSQNVFTYVSKNINLTSDKNSTLNINLGDIVYVKVEKIAGISFIGNVC